ncbi:carboxymuconolactone decarboxylase family protein [Occallatibacter savannae]|uniref:carboxymuconolactone decarboxylase family protein n=1 Tax=Occallatibacter savannae TaxID=1002691 RepID=UPI000D689514|nr:carboxymuconolactone decarboxylase family protein [Occallatibacter savannae]
MAANNTFRSTITPADVQAVSPALASYTRSAVVEGVWNRPGLSRRDRSIVTVATLIARIQTIGMEHYFAIALNSGVTPAEVSEIVTHLAFYCGWSNAFQAVDVLQGIFASRGIGADQLPEISPELLPLNEEAEAKRAAQVQENFGDTSQGVIDNTAKFLFRDLWIRPALAPRDRSLVTVVALVAAGQVAQIPYHLNRAMDSGLTRDEASEVLTHMAFYSGWPTIFSALPVFKDVFAGRKN